MAGARRLLQRKERAEAGRFLAEGAQAVREALASDWPVAELYVTESAAARNADVLVLARERAVPVRIGDDGALASLSDTRTPQGLVAVVEWRDASADAVFAAAPRLVVGLVDCSEPGNLGSIVRVADAAGADAVLLTPDCVDPANPKAVRASTGSVFHLPVVTDLTWTEQVERARAAGLVVLATTGGADAEDLFDLQDAGALSGRTLWQFGSEAHGLPDDVLAAADHRVRIPIHGRAESLNLATAAAVTLYASARSHTR